MPKFAGIAGEAGRRRFQTTRWSLVLDAGNVQSPRFREALNQLCRIYWPPVYAFVRRSGHDPDSAQDLTQGFFLRLLEKNCINAADPEKGKFRSFLLVVLKRYLANEHAVVRSRKRGGGVPHVPLNMEGAETRYQCTLVDDETPERVFERNWATTLTSGVLERLKIEMNRKGSPERTERLTAFLTASHAPSRYLDAATALNLSESAVKVAVHRLRRRYGALLREEVAHTVGDPDSVDDEIRYLFSAMRA